MRATPPGITRSATLALVSLVVCVLASAPPHNSAAQDAPAGFATWTRTNVSSGSQSVVADSINPGVVYTGGFGGFYRSSDWGNTWTRLVSGLASINILALALDPLVPTTLYVATSNGIFRTTDSGGAWTSVNGALPLSDIYQIALDPSTSGTVYVGISGHGVFKSTNGGASWTAASNGMVNVSTRGLAIAPSNPAVLYAGIINPVRMYRSDNGGASWTQAATGLTSAGGTVFIHPSDPYTAWLGTFKTTNGGTTWVQEAGPSLSFRTYDPAHPTVFYAIDSTQRAWRSTDSGATWAVIAAPITSAVTSLALTPGDPVSLYAGGASAVFQLFDGGPAVASVTPDFGRLDGGTDITMSGSGFEPGANVTIGGVQAVNIQVVSSSRIDARTPIGASFGSVEVVVVNPSGPRVAFCCFRYVNPTINTITPNQGPLAGGTPVTINGDGFAPAATVRFGAADATNVVVQSPTSITAVSPPGGPGAVLVRVTNPDGGEGVRDFTYRAAPTVDSVSPNTGPLVGGANVTITGTGFVSGATVRFANDDGTQAATSVNVQNATTITAHTPAHAAGVVTVRVTNTDGQSGELPNAFTYRGAPSVSTVTPATGTSDGGTPVTIEGAGFVTGASVRFGATAATGVSVVNPTTITATTPPHAPGAVVVILSNPDEQTGALGNGFTFVLPPPDANGDSVVNATDSLCVLRQLGAFAATANCPMPLPRADVNGDGIVNATDALCVLRYLGGFSPTTNCPAQPPAGPPASQPQPQP